MQSDQLVAKDVALAYVLVPDEDLSLVAHYVREVVSAALDAGGDVLSFDASLILVAFEDAAEDPGASGRQQTRFLQALDDSAARAARVAYGRFHALVGDLGVPGRRLSRSLVFAGCSECLRVLTSLPPGGRKEI